MTKGPELLGELVRLRPIDIQDADRAWELVQAPDTQHVIGETTGFTRTQIEDWTATIAVQPGRYDYAITSAVQRDDEFVSDDMLGEIVLNQMDEAAGSAKLRLNMLTNYRGRGYGSEALDKMLDFAFTPAPIGLGLHRIRLDVLSTNPRVVGMYEAMGFVVEGVLREAYRDGDDYVDVILLGLLDLEYQEYRSRS